MAVVVDRVYVLPPGCIMEMTDGHLTLTTRPPRPVPNMPIDHLLRSLAKIQKALAVGVILSGNGSDKVIALQAIKAGGGATFAKDEMTAIHPGMPRSAVLDGKIDHVFRPREIAKELERIAGHPYARPEPPAEEPNPVPAGHAVAEIIGLLRLRTAGGFTHDKRSTLQRRIFRRMALKNLQDPKEYLDLILADDREVQSLYQEFLIRVIQFFRDPSAFEALKERGLPANGRRPNSVVRHPVLDGGVLHGRGGVFACHQPARTAGPRTSRSSCWPPT